ncbi:MAG: hypothetical protein EB125_12330, partial [Betaproteobacteria bacterium]|nr:hypothetical protein [Betaproteobacteria bacterium]
MEFVLKPLFSHHITSRRGLVKQVLGGFLGFVLLGTAQVSMAAPDASADVFIKRLTDELLVTVKADKSILSGDINKISALVDQRVMPHVNFQRMTA